MRNTYLVRQSCDYQETSQKTAAQHSEELSKLRKELTETEKVLAEAQGSMLDAIPKSELQSALAKFDALEADHSALQQEVLKLQHVNDKLGTMTPRPNWEQLKPVKENKVRFFTDWIP